MCGIAGIYGLERIDNPQKVVDIMTTALAHRGPDARVTNIIGNAALGHARLSVIDLSVSANQPYCSDDGRFVLCFNGEIYNYRQLKSELVGYQFKTDSDTEVLLAALIEWGMAALQKVNGMFAFSFYDSIENRLFLGRDRMGIKPLYYYSTNESILFASEVRSLLASGLVPRKLNRSAIPEYLQYQCVHAPKTMVEGVKMLDTGSYMIVSDVGVEIKDYWKPWQKPHSDRDEIVIKKRIRDLVTESVEKRLIADVSLGAFLSGGIDSSLLVGVASERLGEKMDTFNVTFDEGEYSESKYARIVAKKFKTNHHEIVLNPSQFLESLPSALLAMDHPSGDGPNSWIVSGETKKQGITVALSGLGGDEVFAGYDVFKQIPMIADKSWWLSFPMPLRKLAAIAMKQRIKGARGRKMAEICTLDYFNLESLYPVFRKVLLDAQIARLTAKKPASNAVANQVANLEEYIEYSNLPTLSRISIAEFGTYMQNVLLRDTDQMSMAHALEVRVPFLDHELVEYAMHIPDAVKFPHSPKKLLVDSFSDLLPPEIVNRPKMGFVLPWESWMKNELKTFCEERIEFLKQTGVFNDRGLDQLWNSFLQNNQTVSWSRIWPLIALSDWMKQNQIEV